MGEGGTTVCSPEHPGQGQLDSASDGIFQINILARVTFPLPFLKPLSLDLTEQRVLLRYHCPLPNFLFLHGYAYVSFKRQQDSWGEEVERRSW